MVTFGHWRSDFKAEARLVGALGPLHSALGTRWGLGLPLIRERRIKYKVITELTDSAPGCPQPSLGA